jgi:hypothetical protein
VTKVSLRSLVRDEKGQALILALILLVIGGLIMAPLLAYMSTGVVAGGAYEKKADELYAADAGAEDAVWKIQDGTEVRPPSCITDPTSWNYSISDVNGKSVAVTITYVSNVTHTYHIVSTATGDGSGTKIDAYVTGDTVAGDFSGITNNVITSQGNITLKHGTEVNPSTGDHSPVENYTGAWPTAEELEAWYLLDVRDATHYYSDTTIDLKGVSQELGPLYVGGELTIKNSINNDATLTLTGVIYATGDTLIGTTEKDFILDLNGQAIFVGSNSTDPKKALSIGGHCTLVGAGAMIAVGDIYFEPNTEAGVTDPVFIMSVIGTSHVQPQGDFYGSIAGSVKVDLWPGTSLNYPEAGFGVIDFPGCTAGRFLYSITSWEVKPA